MSTKNVNPGKFACTLCPLSYQSSRALIAHEKKKHPKTEKVKAPEPPVGNLINLDTRELEVLLEEALRVSGSPVWVRRQGKPEGLEDLRKVQEVRPQPARLFVDSMGSTVGQDLEPHDDQLPACRFSEVLLVLTTCEALVLANVQEGLRPEGQLVHEALAEE